MSLHEAKLVDNIFIVICISKPSTKWNGYDNSKNLISSPLEIYL